MRHIKWHACTVCVTLLLLSVSILHAQTAASPAASFGTYTRHEVTLGAMSPTGPLLGYTFDLSPNLAFETRLSGWPSPLTYAEDAVTLSAGIKAGWRRGRWNYFGTVTPGWGLRPDYDLHYSSTVGNGVIVISPASDRPILRSHFVLQTGVGLEYSITPRTFLRLDTTAYLEPTFDQVQFNDYFLRISSFGYVEAHVAAALAVGHRFGALRAEETVHPSHLAKVDIGALYSLHIRQHLLEGDVTADSGRGGWISYNLAPWISLETAALYAPHDDHTYNFQDGGQESAAFAGVKAGLRRNRFGLFAKLRPGVLSFEHGLQSEQFDSSTFSVTSHAIYQPAIDTGAVLEFYPTRHTILRMDAGDTGIFYRSKTVLVNGISATAGGAGPASSLLIQFGGGLRF